jgi:hypothetical protein
MSDKLTPEHVERLITQRFGARCTGFDATCMTCIAWWLFERVEGHEYDHWDPTYPWGTEVDHSARESR